MNEGICDLSRPKLFNHIFKGALFGGMTYAASHFARQAGTPWIYGLWFIGWICAAAVLRNLHALVICPRFVLSHEGIRLRYWRWTDFMSWGMFRPWNKVVSLTVPWSLYEGCRTFKRSGGDPWDAWEALHIDTSCGTLTIGWDVFARGVDELMQGISEYREMEFRRPLREAVRAIEFQRRRFTTPLRVQEPKVSGSWLAAGCGLILAVIVIVPIGALITTGLLAAHKANILDKVLGYGGGAIALLVLLGYCLRDRRPRLGSRILEFRQEGLAFGNEPDNMHVVPWEDVLYTRMLEETLNPSSDNPAKSTSLFVHLRGFAPVSLGGAYGRSRQELSDLIDPPLDRVRDAWQRIEAGESPEKAAVAAGLPAADVYVNRILTAQAIARVAR
jgi:hypothetical protein